MEWVAIILLSVSLSASVDKEFSTAKECWDYYNIEANYTRIGIPVLTHQGKPIPEDHHFKRISEPYPIRLYKDKDTKAIIWLTCERKKKLTGTELLKYPLTILLPTPT
tara:strand:- start:215 stop:538 length:324 start_codon:yes stop_codon:yes gene_type:complete